MAHTDLKDRSSSIDLLRILSLALVVSAHYSLLPATIGGTHGVVIFFMVSGYCMAFSMQGRTGGAFLAARFWRLVPLLILCATVTATAEALLPQLRPDRLQSWQDYWRNITCLPPRIYCAT